MKKQKNQIGLPFGFFFGILSNKYADAIAWGKVGDLWGKCADEMKKI